MRRLLAAMFAASLSVPAGADAYSDLTNRLRLMRPVDHVGAKAAEDLWRCAEEIAVVLSERVEPDVLDAAWRPASARPTLEDEAAEAMSSCRDEERKAAGVLAAPEFEAIKASVLAIAADKIRTLREERLQLRRE